MRPQLLAANVDVVFIVTAPDGDFNLPRIERHSLGRKMQFVEMSTRQRSNRLGIIEPEGILNGSNRNERSRKTMRMTGNKPAVQSSHQGWASSVCFAS